MALSIFQNFWVDHNLKSFKTLLSRTVLFSLMPTNDEADCEIKGNIKEDLTGGNWQK